MIPRDRLVLGTAKAGMPWYGYNSTSRPTAAESIAILRHAWRKGIQTFDTALGYGDAMHLINAAGIGRCNVITKARLPLHFDAGDYLGLLVHNPTVAEMADLPVDSGVSVYTVEEVAAARRLGIAPIQAPASCLNPPVDVEYGRAPFLQGVLLREPDLAPPALRKAVEMFQALAMINCLTPLELALHSAYGERIVFGVSSIMQLELVLLACEQTVPEKVIAKARELASSVDATAALPSLWSTP